MTKKMMKQMQNGKRRDEEYDEGAGCECAEEYAIMQECIDRSTSKPDQPPC